MRSLPHPPFDYPLSSEEIREAYFLGTREAGAGLAFLRQYSHAVPDLKVGIYVSRVRIETPFFHVAEHSSRTLNYSAQDAVKDFYGKPVALRMYLEICYQIDAPLPNAVKIKVFQRKSLRSRTSAPLFSRREMSMIAYRTWERK